MYIYVFPCHGNQVHAIFFFLSILYHTCHLKSLDTELNAHLHGENTRWPYLQRQLFPSCKSSMLLFCTETMICTFPEPQQRYKANPGLPGKQKILQYYFCYIGRSWDILGILQDQKSRLLTHCCDVLFIQVFTCLKKEIKICPDLQMTLLPLQWGPKSAFVLTIANVRKEKFYTDTIWKQHTVMTWRI